MQYIPVGEREIKFIGLFESLDKVGILCVECNHGLSAHQIHHGVFVKVYEGFHSDASQYTVECCYNNQFSQILTDTP